MNVLGFHVDPDAAVLTRLTDDNISDIWSPVLLYKDGFRQGFGSMCNDPTVGTCIITAGHLFAKKDVASGWSYRTLRPICAQRFPIVKAQMFVTAPQLDVAICTPNHSLPSPPAPKINGFCNESIGLSLPDEIADFCLLGVPMDLTSLVTGSKLTVIGASKRRDNTIYFLAIGTSKPGESGTGYVNTKDSQLYIQKGGGLISDIAKRMPQVPSHAPEFIFLAPLRPELWNKFFAW